MRRFTQTRSISQTSDGKVTFQWTTNESEDKLSITAIVPDSHEEKLEFIRRMICHFQVEKMPAEGLDELGNTLQELIDFYIERQNVTLPTPNVYSTRIVGRMTGERERPQFYITE